MALTLERQLNTCRGWEFGFQHPQEVAHTSLLPHLQGIWCGLLASYTSAYTCTYLPTHPHMHITNWWKWTSNNKVKWLYLWDPPPIRSVRISRRSICVSPLWRLAISHFRPRNFSTISSVMMLLKSTPLSPMQNSYLSKELSIVYTQWVLIYSRLWIR